MWILNFRANTKTRGFNLRPIAARRQMIMGSRSRPRKIRGDRIGEYYTSSYGGRLMEYFKVLKGDTRSLDYSSHVLPVLRALGAC